MKSLLNPVVAFVQESVRLIENICDAFEMRTCRFLLKGDARLLELPVKGEYIVLCFTFNRKY